VDIYLLQNNSESFKDRSTMSRKDIRIRRQFCDGFLDFLASGDDQAKS